ncbi:uncharacterized protein LOC143481901 isoform X2 [Brachyhypopomus gauderio]|uniref:uncharacterized protein LOC143481901 isoform X2 n=1 Tax=Brachyhypopomus gauderio TaxID=698409 RepID=UPI00404175EF
MDAMYYFVGYKKHFQEVNFTGDECLHMGDILMRKIENKMFHHAAIYCGKKEVIEFTAPQEKPQSSGFMSLPSINYSEICGEIYKIGLNRFKTEKLRVFRLRAGVPATLDANIENAMQRNIKYHLTNFNCFHFALCILEMKDWPASRPEIGPEEEQEEEMEDLCSNVESA